MLYDGNPRDVGKYPIVIADGEKVSSATKLELGYFPCNIIVPIIDTSTKVQFQVSLDGTTYVPLNNQDGTRYELTVDPTKSAGYSLSSELFYGWNFIKVEVADAQTGAKTFIVGGTNW